MSWLKKSLIHFAVITVFILLLIVSIPIYFFYTEQGNKNFSKFISYSASKKAGFDVDIKSLNLNDYPYISADILVDQKYKVFIDGFIHDLGDRSFDLNYTIKSHAIQYDIIRVNGTVDINGTLKGKKRLMHITGAGSLLDGNVSYALSKERKVYKDIDLTYHDINATKLLKLLDQDPLFNGKSNAHLHFDHFENKKKRRKGTIRLSVLGNNFNGHITDVDLNATMTDSILNFDMDANTTDLALTLTQGSYDLDKKYAQAKFDLNVSDLGTFEKELGEKYFGEFLTNGVIIYDDHIYAKGMSKSMGGLLSFDYNDTLLQVNLKDIPFSSIMKRIDFDAPLEAKTNGDIIYDLEKKEMQSKIVLLETKVLPSDLSDTLMKKFDYDILGETFTQSSIEVSLKNKVYTSKVILANDKNHLVLKDTKFDTKKKIIDTYMDLKTPVHFLKGNVFARIDDYITRDIYLKFDGIAEKYYAVKLDGLFNEDLINMDYAIQSHRFPSHILTIEDNVSIRGHINGPLTHLRVRGKGTALNGEIRFDAVKKSDHLENVKLRMKQIHALKLSTLLGYPDLPYGKADINASFSTLSQDAYDGTIDYVLRAAHYDTLPLTLKAHVEGNEKTQHFNAQIRLANADINLSEGVRDGSSSLANAFYTVDTKDLTQLEPMLGARYMGAFFSVGNISFKNSFQIRGITKSFGGMIDYLYKNDMLIIDIERSSLQKLLALFTTESLLDATAIGNINYDFNKKLLLVDSKLKNARFLPSRHVDKLFKTTGINLLRETFDQSSLHARFQNKVLLGNLILQGNTAHFYLNNIKLDFNDKMFNALFDLNMQRQEFTGRIYGKFDKPKFNLNMQKLLKYQMNKQLDTYMGEGNRKMMESMPMGGTAKDMATDMGGGFMDMFF